MSGESELTDESDNSSLSKKNSTSRSSSAGSSDDSSSRSSASKMKRKKDKKKTKKKKQDKKRKDKKKKEKKEKKTDKKPASNRLIKLHHGSSMNQSSKQSGKTASQIDYRRIVEREKLYEKLHLDNYAILLHLIEQDEHEVRQAFQNFSASMNDAAGLQAELMAKTEEAYQVMLENSLTNEEQTQVRKKRSAKSEDYLMVFRRFINGLRLGQPGTAETLMSELREIAMHSMREQHSRLNQQQSFDYAPSAGRAIQREMEITPKDQGVWPASYRDRLLKTLLNYLQDGSGYQSQAGLEERNRFLTQQFNRENQELYNILSGPLSTVPQHLDRFVQRNLYDSQAAAMASYGNLREAVLSFNERGLLQDIDRDVIMTMLSYKDDKSLLASWEVYQVLHDEEDLLETLQILADVKRREQPETYSEQALMMPRD